MSQIKFWIKTIIYFIIMGLGLYIGWDYMEQTFLIFNEDYNSMAILGVFGGSVIFATSFVLFFESIMSSAPITVQTKCDP